VRGERRLPEPPRRNGLPAAVNDRARPVEMAADEVAREEGVAVGGVSGAAVHARLAGVEGQHHVIARREPGDPAADGLDDAGALVSGDDRRRGQETRYPGQQVGVAQAGADDAHHDLVRTRTGQVDVLDAVGPVRRAQHSRSDLHGDPPDQGIQRSAIDKPEQYEISDTVSRQVVKTYCLDHLDDTVSAGERSSFDAVGDP
jgi:hypothetical protein